MGISEICEKLVFDATGFDFKTTVPYQMLIEKAISPRNKVVHGTKLTATSQEAHASFNSVLNAIGAIHFTAPVISMTNKLVLNRSLVPPEGLLMHMPPFPLPESSPVEPNHTVIDMPQSVRFSNREDGKLHVDFFYGGNTIHQQKLRP